MKTNRPTDPIRYAIDRVTRLEVPDPFLKVIDVRMGARTMNVMQFLAGPSCVAFNPKYTSVVIVCSHGGVVQAVDAATQGGGGFANYHLQLADGYGVVPGPGGMAVSSSGESVAFADDAGYVHLWGVNASPTVNVYSVHTEVPPFRAACVDRHDAGEINVEKEEHKTIPPPPWHMPHDATTPPLSELTHGEVIKTGLPPHIIPKSVLDNVTWQGGGNEPMVGYAPNPYYRRGRAKGEANRAAMQLQRKREVIKFKSEVTKTSALSSSNGFGGGVGGERARASTCPLPKLYHKVEAILDPTRARFEEFDFAAHNRTALLGMGNDLANCYVNPVLQILHFVPGLRASVLMGHACEREFCLTCELAFLSHTLSQPPTRGGGSHSSASMKVEPLNFLRTLRQVREAAALGLIEGGGNELEARLDQSLPRRIQAFQRFILEQLHKEQGGGDDRPVRLGEERTKQKTPRPRASRSNSNSNDVDEDEVPALCAPVEDLFAVSSSTKNSCAVCGREETKMTRSFQTDLAYPPKEAHKGGAAARRLNANTNANPKTADDLHAFSALLAKSLATRGEVRCVLYTGFVTHSPTSSLSSSFDRDAFIQYSTDRADKHFSNHPGITLRAWCDGHDAYTRMTQKKTPVSLPAVMSVSLGMRDVGDLRWWGVDVDAPPDSRESSEAVETSWLPKFFSVKVAGENVCVTESSTEAFECDDDGDGDDDDGASEHARYELTGLVCLARRPCEEEDDDAPGGGVDETGAKILRGHLMSFVKVKPPYIAERGAFGGASVVGEGKSPGVSPLVIGQTGAAAKARADAAAAAARVSELRVSGDDDGAEGGSTETASEITPADADAGSAVREEIEAEDAANARVKAAQFAAALAAGEAMYGEHSGFAGVTPSKVSEIESSDTADASLYPPYSSWGSEGQGANAGEGVRVSPDGVADTDWLLFNDFCITPVRADEVTRMYGVAKIPCIAAYSRVDAPPPPPLPPSPITEDVYRRLTLDANLPRRCPFTPFDFESPAETPRPG